MALAAPFVSMRVALIGAGAVNFGGGEGPWDHASRLERLGAEIVAVVDPLTDKARDKVAQRAAADRGFAHQWAGCEVFASVEEMLRQANPTAAFIGVPPSFHGCYKHPIELLCLRAGVHVFVEKPLSNTPVDEALKYAAELEAVRQEKNLVVSVGYMFRSSAFAREIKRLLADRQVVCFSARYNTAYANIPSPFWWDSDHCGGPIVEQATHFVDLARYLVGEADMDSVYARSVKANLTPGTLGHLAKVPVDESGVPERNRVPRCHVANWSFQSGALGSLVHGALLQGMKYDASVELMADGLRIQVVEPYSDCPMLRVLEGSSDEEKVLEFPGDDMYLTEDEEFLTAISSGEGASAKLKCEYGDAINTYTLTCKIRDEALAH